MTAPSHCLECAAPLTVADAGGLCARCLLRLGLASQLAAGTLPATAPGLTPDGAVREPFDFGGYRILRLLGKGGMGAVYEAEHLESGRRVALKVLGQTLDTPELRARFVREGQLAAGVRHGHVVAVLAAEEIEGAPVIAMELLHDGTLRDRVKAGGPMAISAAVDAILQVIDGLEAAHAGGVLHRDVKPANCFIDRDGTVKVGDFGLSISTLVKAENSLTHSGAVLGTPAFAAPEQLRGQEIDARADIYAVGATLYFLLTGKPTHDADTLVALIAAVLEKKPADVRGLRAGLPRGLAAAVMRCLEKEPARRFPDYAALRAALVPYSSVAPTPAMLGLRFAACLFDLTLAGLPVWILSALLLGETPETWWLQARTWSSFGWFVLGTAFFVAWFAVPEALWGRTVGKALCGLRVVRADGGAVGWGAALGRATIFLSHEILPYLLTAWLYPAVEYAALDDSFAVAWTEFFFLPLFALLFVTMRRRNGYAALYDLVTGTRVVSEFAAAAALPQGEKLELPADLAGRESVGPFVILSRAGELAEALDPALRRGVWVRFVAAGTPPLAAPRRDISRVTRLRWLQGRRAGADSWDAFERPDGAPLAKFSDRAQPWSRVRVWLADLAEECNAALGDGTTPEEVGRSRVWITAAGRAVLLDFLPPGLPAESAQPVRDAAEVQTFLHDVAAAALSPRVPLHAREFLATLREQRLEAPSMVSGNLRALLNRPAEVAPRRRALSLALGLVCVLSFALLGLSVFTVPRWSFDEAWHEAHPGQPSPRLALETMSSQDPRAVAVRPALAARLVREHGEALIGERFWSAPELADLLALGLITRSPAESEIATQLGNIARQGTSGALPADSKLDRLLERRAVRESGWFWMIRISVGLLSAGGICATLFALIAGTPPGLRMFGFAVVRKDGARAGRFRVALRTLLAWSPVILADALFYWRDGWLWETESRFPFGGLGVLAAMISYWVAGLLAGRGPAEKATGTWIVPR